MKVSVLLIKLVLVLAGLVQLQKGVAVGRGQVHALDIDVDRRRGREHLEQPQAARSSGPSIAKDGLVVAVDKPDVWGARQDGELGGCLVEGFLDLQAVTCRMISACVELDAYESSREPTEASLVPTRDQNPPLLGLGRLGLDRRIESVLPVIKCQDVQLHLANLGLCSSNRIMLAGVWYVGAELAKEVLELCLVLLELLTLSRCQHRQSQ